MIQQNKDSGGIVRLPSALHYLRQYDFPRKLGVMERLFGSRLSSLGESWVQCANGITWKVNLADPCHRWMVYGRYEGGVGIDFACNALADGGVYVDSGASIGQWLMYIAGLPGVRTLAFEPVPDSRQWLEECIGYQRGWQENCEVQEHALGSEEGLVEIQCDGARSTMQMGWYGERALPRLQVSIRPLESVLKEKDVDHVGFWKLDVEGNELDALQGAGEYLIQRRIDYIHLECHPDNLLEVRDLLESCGYALHCLNSGKPLPFRDTAITTTRDILALVPT